MLTDMQKVAPSGRVMLSTLLASVFMRRTNTCAVQDVTRAAAAILQGGVDATSAGSPA